MDDGGILLPNLLANARAFAAPGRATLPQDVKVTATPNAGPRSCEEVDSLRTHLGKDIAAKLKLQVTELNNLSVKKTVLQGKLDAIKAQYQGLLTEMRELQAKLNEDKRSSSRSLRITRRLSTPHQPPRSSVPTRPWKHQQ